MPLYRIHSPAPGAFVEGIGIIPNGAEIDLPEKHIVRRPRGSGVIRVRVAISPRASWEPLDDAAKALFEKHRGNLNDKDKATFDRLHAKHKAGASSEHEGEEVIEDLVAAGLEEEVVDEDLTIDKKAKPKAEKFSDKPTKRASDT